VLAKTGICIGLTPSSYFYEFEVSYDKLKDVLYQHYCYSRKYKLEYTLIPQSVNSITEHTYRLIRESRLPYLPCEQIQNACSDFLIANCKVQEKVAYMWSGRYVTTLKKCYKRLDVCYEKGDNDFYWIWLKEQSSFYIIPEQFLIENEYIDRADKKLILFFIEDVLLDTYKYDLNDPNLKDKLQSLFSV
jgi:hypothetical protein